MKDILPRRYQEEVFARAQQENIIAALHTGSGKTLISLLLIRWISAFQTSKDKVVIFLVPKVALVEQQGNFIAQNTSLRVLKLHGALDIDLADRGRWRKRFENHDVFIMTAQIFLNILTHSIWGVDKVSLMIFDECHHARKNHPYNGIMREYFEFPDASRRPKIFGMTASPIWNPKDPIGSLITLETNMDSKVIGVHTNAEELQEHIPKPTELIKEYPHPLEDAYTDFPSPTLWDTFQVFEKDIWTELEIPWNVIETRYYSTLYNLGPFAASRFLHSEVEQHIIRIYDSSQKEAMDDDAELNLPLRVQRKQPPADFWHIYQVHAEFGDFFSTEPSLSLVNLAWCTPKVKTLVELLLAYHKPGFQGIVFVEQRQTATSLAEILTIIPELKGLLRCGALMGQGVNGDGVAKPSTTGQKQTVESFRRGDIDLLIATSVAEEGLDFPACDLVIRFDPMAHMVGYVQSRGRARNKTSTFVVMIQEGDNAQFVRYETLKTVEPEVNKVYQSRSVTANDTLEDDLENETPTPADLAERERYTVNSTGAVLTYDNSISLLNRLCSLIPRDTFTSQHVPTFSGDFNSTLVLPPSIPLPLADRTFAGPQRRSKKEARRAVAFMAVKRLHQLDVFDDFLLPASRSRGDAAEDVDGRPLMDVSQVPAMMDVSVNDPWSIGRTLWIHPVYIDGAVVAGLVTGTKLHTVKLFCINAVHTGPGQRMVFENEDHESHKRKLMLEFTKLGIWLRITARPFTLPPSLFLVPLTASFQVDYDAIEALVNGPRGYPDWSVIDESALDNLIVMNTNQLGRTYLLHNIRNDLSPMSEPAKGSREEGHQTYYDYFVQAWTRKKWVADVPRDGPLLELHRLPRSPDGAYTLDVGTDNDTAYDVPNGLLAPQNSCRWFALSPSLRKAYEILPALLHRLTVIFRAHLARFQLALPPVHDDLLVEALTLPSADIGYSNQRLETLGDGVLKLCTTVHLYNKYPYRHEGQLSLLRQHSVSNRFLLARAKEIGLEAYVISERTNVQKWRYVEEIEKSLDPTAHRLALRQYPRRSLQDCMEAIIGACFMSGGIPMALFVGTSLGLAFGGTIPWSIRYSRSSLGSQVPPYFASLEENLGYTFHQPELLVEAVTHPSMFSSGASYQRLEFLGDALLDLVVLNYLYKKFPEATSHQLSLPKAKAICSPSLAYLSVRRLNLHRILLVGDLDLIETIDAYVPLLESTTEEEIVKRGWRYNPPKALSDVFESVMGALLIDTGYNYEKAAAVVEHVMEGVLMALSPSILWDPVTTLAHWTAQIGCSKLSIESQNIFRDGKETQGVVVTFHGETAVGPIKAGSQTVAKFIACERALTLLKDSDDGHAFLKLCDCRSSEKPVSQDAEATQNCDHSGKEE
ncbi:hypothetical protein H0H93_001096 [Arthromyces matolae]|nr:hypothetical protein H0H93_001096 [Arthromyces matolae]